MVIGGHENDRTVPGPAGFHGFAELSEDNISEGQAIHIATDGGVLLGEGSGQAVIHIGRVRRHMVNVDEARGGGAERGCPIPLDACCIKDPMLPEDRLGKGRECGRFEGGLRLCHEVAKK